MSTSLEFVNFLEEFNKYRAETFSGYLTFNGLSKDILLIFVALIFIFSTCLRYVDITDFIIFLEDYIRYRADIFNLHYCFIGLSNDVSHVVVAQNFIISTCLRYVDKTDFVNFLEDYNRYKVEISRV